MAPRGLTVYALGGVFTVAGAFLATGSTVLGVLVIVATVATVMLMFWGPDEFGARLMVMALFLAPLNDLRPIASNLELSFADICLAVGAMALLPRLLVHKARTPTPLAVGGLFLFLMVLASAPMADNGAYSVGVGLRLVGAAILLPLLVCFWLPDRRQLHRLAGAYVLGQTLSLVVALLEGKAEVGRYTGLAAHPNYFAIGGLVAVALSPYLYSTSLSRHRWIWAALGLVAFWSVYISGSRGALLAVLALAVVYPLIERSSMTGYLLMVVTFMSLPFLRVIADNASDESALGRLLGKSASVEGSDETRRQTLAGGWERFLHSPVWGNGFEQNLEIHNVFLQVLVAVGVIGFVAWAMIMSSLLLPLFGTHPDRMLSYATLAYLGIALTEPVVWDRIIWLPMALALLGSIRRDEDVPTTDHPSREVSVPAA